MQHDLCYWLTNINPSRRVQISLSLRVQKLAQHHARHDSSQPLTTSIRTNILQPTLRTPSLASRHAQYGGARKEEAQAEDQDPVHVQQWPGVCQSIKCCRLFTTCCRNTRSDVARRSILRRRSHHATSGRTRDTSRTQNTQDQAIYQQEPAVHAGFRVATSI